MMVEKAKSNRNNDKSSIEDLQKSLMKLVDCSTADATSEKTSQSLRIVHSTSINHKEMETTITINMNERLTLTQENEPVAYRLVRINEIPEDVPSSNAITTENVLVDPRTSERYYRISPDYCVDTEGDWFMMEVVANNVHMVTECEELSNESIVSISKITRNTSDSSYCKRKHYSMDFDLELSSDDEPLIIINSTIVHDSSDITCRDMDNNKEKASITISKEPHSNPYTSVVPATDTKNPVADTIFRITNTARTDTESIPTPKLCRKDTVFSHNILTKYVKDRIKGINVPAKSSIQNDKKYDKSSIQNDKKYNKSSIQNDKKYNKSEMDSAIARSYVVTDVVRMSQQESDQYNRGYESHNRYNNRNSQHIPPHTPLQYNQRIPYTSRERTYNHDIYNNNSGYRIRDKNGYLYTDSYDSYNDTYGNHDYRVPKNYTSNNNRQNVYPTYSNEYSNETYNKTYQTPNYIGQTGYKSSYTVPTTEHIAKNPVQESYSLSSHSSLSVKTVSAPSICTINQRCIKADRVNKIGRGCCSGRIYSQDIPPEAWNRIELGDISQDDMSGYLPVDPRSAKAAIQQANNI